MDDLNINELRERIDALDRAILSAFEKRMETVALIGRYKRKNALPLEDPAREKSMLEKYFPDPASSDEFSAFSQQLLLELISISKTYQRKALNLYLTGMPASGKSETAQALEKHTKKQAIDTDIIVSDRAGRSIEQIFEDEGEEGFRIREHEALMIAAEHGSLIVATGGGILTRAENIDMMRKSGYIVFLDVPLDRLLKSPITGRPLISSEDDVTRLYYERIVDYKTNADMVIDPETPDFMARLLEFMRDRELI